MYSYIIYKARLYTYHILIHAFYMSTSFSLWVVHKKLRYIKKTRVGESIGQEQKLFYEEDRNFGDLVQNSQIDCKNVTTICFLLRNYDPKHCHTVNVFR